MFLKGTVLVFIGLMSGMAVSAGTFAFLLMVGVVPRMLRTTNLMDKVLTMETAISLGVVFGTVMSLWARQPDSQLISGAAAGLALLREAGRWLGHFLLCIYGLSAGIFVGCIAVELAEILDTFPIMFRRMKIAEGAEEYRNNQDQKRRAGKSTPQVQWLMYAMAFGKLAGSLFSFYGGYRF